jgi:NAD(P)-dependent dehydrogenase (short-subunit alcohol dehydrogenase family)
MKLSGKTAIVTGAAYGIGLAAARKLAEDGAAVVIADIKGYEAAAASLSHCPGTVVGMHADVTSDESVAKLVGDVVGRFGSVDILVNNAAISAELKPGPFEQQSIHDWRRIYEVNVIGVFRMCRAVSPHMRARQWGRIINIASGTAFKGVPGLLHYVASKGAILSMTRTLATEFGSDNVLVNCVSPGLTLTESVRASKEVSAVYGTHAVANRIIKRDALAIDVANVIYFLATEEASFITGQTIAADGGSVFH